MCTAWEMRWAGFRSVTVYTHYDVVVVVVAVVSRLVSFLSTPLSLLLSLCLYLCASVHRIKLTPHPNLIHPSGQQQKTITQTQHSCSLSCDQAKEKGDPAPSADRVTLEPLRTHVGPRTAGPFTGLSARTVLQPTPHVPRLHCCRPALY